MIKLSTINQFIPAPLAETNERSSATEKGTCNDLKELIIKVLHLKYSKIFSQSPITISPINFTKDYHKPLLERKCKEIRQLPQPAPPIKSFT